MNLSEQAYDYSVRIVELVRYLRESGKGFPLDEELLSCGIDAGMVLKSSGGDSVDAESAKKASAALQKAEYLIGMAVGSGYLTAKESEHIVSDTRLLLQKIKRILDEIRIGGFNL